jgi:HK97 gp10 family phage protein
MPTKLVIVRDDIPAIMVRTNSRVVSLTDAVRGEVLREAQANCPVDEGTLRDSGHIDGDDVIFDAVNAIGRPYGPYVEYGTRHMAAQPFLTPAAERVKPLLFGGMAKILKG